MATVIDSLIVKIGLTSDKFKKQATEVVKGVEEVSKAETKAQQKNTETLAKETGKRKKITQKTQKENEQSRKKEIADNKKALETQNKDTEEAVRQQTKAAESSMSIPGMIAKRFAPAYIAYKALGMGKELAETSSSVYRLSHSLADSSEEVRTWMEALNLVGGNADEAKNNIVDLQSKLDKFHLYGEGVKELSNVFGNMGVSLYNASGQAKSALEIMEDIGKYVRDNPDHLPQNLLASRVAPAGVTQDMFYLMRNEQRDQIMGSAEILAKRFQDEEKANQKAVETAKDILSTGKSYLGKATGAVTEFFSGTPGVMNQQNVGMVSRGISKVSKELGVSEAELKAIAQNESSGGLNVNHSRSDVFGPMGLLESGAAKDYGVTKYSSYEDQIRAAGKHYLRLKNKFGSAEAAAAAYNEGEGNYQKYGVNNPETTEYVARFKKNLESFRSSPNASNVTNMQIDKITVNTQATDSKGIARDLSKDLVQQVNRGMQ